jgi:hypothetical protein
VRRTAIYLRWTSHFLIVILILLLLSKVPEE